MKKFALISCVLLTFIIGVYFYYYSDNEKYVLENSKSKQIINSNSLTLMYETEEDSGEYQVSSDNTWPQEGYAFNETLSKCENGSSLTWNSESNRVILEANTSDRCYVYFDVVLPPILVEYITTEAYTGNDGDNGLYYHDGIGSYTNANLEAGDNSYRYAGENPNNFVCFGSDAGICSEDNLYRIIGVFDGEVKLIKADYATASLLGTDGDYSGIVSELGRPTDYYKGSIDRSLIGVYYWNNSTSANTWSESNLNTVNLNQNYINNIGSKWSNLIATTSWQVGGMLYNNLNSVKDYYMVELGSNSSSTTYSTKIGLMYVSDYGYAASPDNWNTDLFVYNNDTNRNNNWMYMGLSEWAITHPSDSSSFVFSVYGDGKVGTDFAFGSYSLGSSARPSFYLNADVQYISGTGTQTDPYRIA